MFRRLPRSVSVRSGVTPFPCGTARNLPRFMSTISSPSPTPPSSPSSPSSSSPSSSSSSLTGLSPSVALHGVPASKMTHHPFSTHLPGALTQFADFIVDHAQGSWVYGTNGRKYLDFNTGIGVTSLGHCHPAVTSAAKSQVDRGIHLQVNCVTSQPMLELASKLVNGVLPRGLDQIFFSNSGAESVENAIKLARHATGRPAVIVLQGGYHGRTIATGALTTAKPVYRAGFQPAPSGIFVAPYAYCHRCPVSACDPERYNVGSCCSRPIDELRLLLKQQVDPCEVAAILFEPVLGEGGYVVPPKSFLQDLRKVANDIGALLIADEVQSGFGRTGTYFAVEQFGITPDILIMAKGIASGFVLSGIAAPSAIFSKQRPGSIGGTYAGNAVSCAAACAVVDVFERENILANVRARGEQLRAGLLQLQKKFPIADVRGLGLMQAIEFNKDVPYGTASAVSRAVLGEGLLLLNTGIYETIRIIPPLIISENEMAQGLIMLEKGLNKVFNKK